ncbi:NAD(P)/FAD-dependent oxidoreductase [Nocardia pseudobrasiliensis]|uniref:Flavin-dependent dehydrogenase n=1 Tax=Nocardia pseudobrasiliensis TaxID=45979 RepID=A0A370I6N5_9NOCA|nr:NAD(P)/FAD-dependent oxidoreductase [Nocardia pseudobrasiliensis]RDI64984.1 flavin-dependent dehydrogenase [Nocardia pseudobrasiliensis]
MYDVIVVGARVAGAPAAMLFARLGYRVLLLERSRFPKDTLSTLYLHQPAVALLDQWQVLAEIKATGCSPIKGTRYTTGGLTLEGCSWPAAGHRITYAPRRYLLDSILADAAVAAGVEFRDNCAVRGVVFDDERVVGVRVNGGASGEIVERATLVVGADGMRSTVAAAVGAPMVREDSTASCAYYSYWAELPSGFELYDEPGHWVGLVPTNDDLTLVASYFPQEQFGSIRNDAMRSFLTSIEQTSPELRERLAGGRNAERLFGTGDQRNYFRQAAGPGWALIGDAGHHKDSITARGITDAFRQAQLLVERVGTELHDPVRLTRALDRFAVERTEVLLPEYRNTLETAKLAPPEHRLTMLRAIATEPDMVDRFFSTWSGVCPIDEFVTPELLDLVDAHELNTLRD